MAKAAQTQADKTAYVVTDAAGPELYGRPYKEGDEIELSEAQAADPMRRGWLMTKQKAAAQQRKSEKQAEAERNEKVAEATAPVEEPTPEPVEASGAPVDTILTGLPSSDGETGQATTYPRGRKR